MKTALCLYGNIRKFDKILPSLYAHIIHPYSPDIFAFTWVSEEEKPINKFDRNHPLWKNKVKHNIISKSYMHSVVNSLNPKAIILEDATLANKTFLSYTTKFETIDNLKHWNMPVAFLKGLWAQEECVKLKQKYEKANLFKYDKVILSRWDVIYDSSLQLHDLSLDTLSMPQSFTVNGPSDFWICGSSENIDICSKRFSNIENISATNCIPDHPCSFLNQFIDNYNISHERLDLPINLLNRNW